MSDFAAELALALDVRKIGGSELSRRTPAAGARVPLPDRRIRFSTGFG